MHRRSLLMAGLAAPLCLATSRSQAASGWRRFEITTRIDLDGGPGAARLWVPLCQTAGSYQTAIDLRWQTDAAAGIVHDAIYGAELLQVIWAGDAAVRSLTVVQTIATRDRGAEPMLPLTAAERLFWLQPTASVPTDGIVKDTADRITAGRTTPRARLRALYDWVVDTSWRDASVRGCGTGDVRAMLQGGHFGGKCADINSLMVGLARAAGFPARDVYGTRVADSRLFPSLGKSGDITRAQHCRAEAWLDETGWLPLDPADVRKVILEQHLAADSPEVASLRDRLFGAWEMNWVGYNSATDIRLPGATQPMQQSFLMYPCAMTPHGQPDCLDPQAFRYRLDASELTAA